MRFIFARDLYRKPTLSNVPCSSWNSGTDEIVWSRFSGVVSYVFHCSKCSKENIQTKNFERTFWFSFLKSCMEICIELYRKKLNQKVSWQKKLTRKAKRKNDKKYINRAHLGTLGTVEHKPKNRVSLDNMIQKPYLFVFQWIFTVPTKISYPGTFQSIGFLVLILNDKNNYYLWCHF